MSNVIIKFSNLVLHGKFCKAVRFFYKQEIGGVFQPDELALDKMGVINETVAYVLEGNIRTKKFPPVLRWRHTRKILFLFL